MLSRKTQEIIRLVADELASAFTPPELFVGCEILSVDDKDQYASDNGWIEARVGQHNRQRCRWRGQFADPQVNDFVDVLYFASFRLFVVLGQGGTGAAAGPGPHNLLSTSHPDTLPASVVAGDIIIGNATPKWARLAKGNDDDVMTMVAGFPAWAAPTGGSGWPYDKIITVSPTDAGADFATIQDANDNTTGPAIVVPDGGVYTETLILSSGSIGYTSLGARSEVTITSSDATTIDITGSGIALRNLTVINNDDGATATVVQTVEDNTTLNGVRILKTAGLSTTSIGLHVTGGGDTGTQLTDGVISVTAGTTKYGILMDTDTCYLLVDGGQIQGDTYDIRLNNANAFLTLQNDVKFLGGGIQVAAGHIISDEPIVTTITGPYTADTAINGKSPAESIIATAQNTTDVTLTPNASDLQFANWTIRNTGAGGGGISHTALTNAQTGLVLDGCVIERKTGSCTTSIAFSSSAGDTLARNCKFNSAGGLTVNYAVYLSAASTVIIEGGEITAGSLVTAHASAVLELRGVKLGSGVTLDSSGGGTIRGWYIDSNGIVRLIGAFQLFKPNYPTNDIWRCNAASKSDFVATINGTPSGTSVVYNAPSSGDENNLVPNSTSQIAKMVLHNTTRGTNALISNNNSGTNTITLTATVPAGWASGDTITIRSQTNTSNPATNVYYVDFEFTSDVDSLAKSFIPTCVFRDTGAAASLVVGIFHPFEANSTSKSRPARLTGTNVTIDFTMPMIPLISSRFCLAWDATGTGTLLIIIRLSGEGAAYQ